MADPDLLVESFSRRRYVEEVGWSSLPDDLLEQALALLSFPEVYRLRCVCKRWNALIQERRLSWGPFYPPRFGWAGQGSRAVRWFAYDLVETTMRKTTMPQLEFPECARKAHWNLIAAGGGLLCFGAFTAWRRILGCKPMSILVCNPMTKAWRELPDVNLRHHVSLQFFGTHWSIFTHLVVDESGSAYKILFAGDAGVDVYDSAANDWSALEPPFPRLTYRSGAYCKGKMYLMGKMVSNGPYLVWILELATMRWREDTIPMPVTSAECPHTVASCGEVYLVMGSSEMPIKSILMFRLDPGRRWTR